MVIPGIPYTPGEKVVVPSNMNIAIVTAKSFEFFGVNIRHPFLHQFSLMWGRCINQDELIASYRQAFC
jgi:hypothetical protein